MSLYWTKQQNTVLGPRDASQIFWSVGEDWETQAPYKDAPDWEWTKNTQSTASPSYTTIVLAYNNPEQPRQRCRRCAAPCSTSPAAVLHMHSGPPTTHKPGARSAPPAALQHLVLWCLSPASPQHPLPIFCVLLPRDSTQIRPPSMVSVPGPMYHRHLALLDVDCE